MQTLDQNLAALVKSNKIGLAEARSKAKVPEAF
jgi:Tfp pilus assembly ATPase PilU